MDIDLPIALTQNDEVSFPVAVYNYLKNPQTVKLDLKQEDWFTLVDGQGLTRTLDLKPNEVTSVQFRIRASKIRPLRPDRHGRRHEDVRRGQAGDRGRPRRQARRAGRHRPPRRPRRRRRSRSPTTPCRTPRSCW